MQTYSKNKIFNVIVVGAGASGLMAAISAAKNGLHVLVLEKMEKAGRKLFISGKGRCNLTNNSDLKTFIENIYPDGRFLYPVFKKFFVDDLINFFENAGVPLVLERGDRYFPKSNKSSDIVKALVNECNRLNVDFLFNSKVVNLLCENNVIVGVEYESEKKRNKIFSDSVILCTGGKSYPATGSTGDGYYFAEKLGHKIIIPKPALVPLIFENNLIQKTLLLKNINAKLIINQKIIKQEFGELEISNEKLSGPIILTLSRWAVEELLKNNKVEINIDIKPALTPEKLNLRLLNDFEKNPKTKLKDLLKLLLPNDFIELFLEKLKLDANKEANIITKNEREKIINLLKNFPILIIDYKGFEESIITNGGINLTEINPKTLESKIVKNLYFAGEILNLDAKTGGYNLQIAFSTGWFAGKNLFN